MAITVASSADNSVIGTNISINKPSGLAENDLMIAQLGVNGGGGTVTITGTGWTQIISSGSAVNDLCTLFYKVATASDVAASSFSFSQSGSSAAFRGIILRVTGASTSSIVATSNQASTTSSGSMSFANTITPTTAGSLILMAYSCDDTLTTISSWAIATNNPSWTNIWADTISGLTYAVRTEITATGNSSFNEGTPGSGNYNCILVAINPAGTTNKNFLEIL